MIPVDDKASHLVVMNLQRAENMPLSADIRPEGGGIAK